MVPLPSTATSRRQMSASAATQPSRHAEELADMKKEASTSQLPEVVDPTKPKNAFKASMETKQMDLVKGDSSKQVTIGSGLDDK